jgi:hypothetical protein
MNGTMKKRWTMLVAMLLGWVLTCSAQPADTIRQRMDSLQRELHAMKVKELVLQNRLDEN